MNVCGFLCALHKSNLATAITLLLCTIAIPSIFAAESSQTKRKRIVPGSAIRNRQPEKMCGANVRPRQVLFKVAGCPTNLKASQLRDKLQLILRAIDDTLVLTSVGTECLFSAKSTRKTVPELIEDVQSFWKNLPQRSKRQLRLSGLDGLRLEYVEPNFVIRIEGNDSLSLPLNEPNDEKYRNGDQWGLLNRAYPGFDIDAPKAWEYSTGSDSIVVGIVDTGIFYCHPDLAANMWAAPQNFTTEVAGRQIKCPQGSHGYDALAPPGGECDPMDDNGHGTHVAGIVGAVGDDHIGVVGVNWNVRLMALRFADASGSGDVEHAVNAIEFALQVKEQFKTYANVKVLNNSWGFTVDSRDCPVNSQALLEVVQKALSKDVLFVASAGENSDDNDQHPHYPSGYDLFNVLSVTALNNDGTLTTIQHVASNLGKRSVHLAAPGDDIWSTCLPQKNYYCQKSFTSVAAPFVSGAGALMFSIPRCAKLGAPGIRMKILEGTTRTASMVNPITNENLTLTAGRLTLSSSIELCR